MRRALLVVLITVVGCSSGKLDRKTAMEKINQEFARRQPKIGVRVGRVGSHCEKVDDGHGPQEVDLNPTKDVQVVIAHLGGYLESVPDGPDFWNNKLTEKGQKLVSDYNISPVSSTAIESSCGYQVYVLPLATAQVSEVTGIKPGDRTAQVDVIWNWNLTEIGKGLRADGEIYRHLDDIERGSIRDFLAFRPGPVLPIPVPSDETLKAPHHDTALFEKYDDGWRVHRAE